MLQSRRGFLIGAGSLLTTAFVSDARSFIRRTSQPLLASPAEVAQTMYWYELELRMATRFHSASGRWSRRPRRPGASSSSTKAFRTRPRKRSSGFTTSTALGRRTTTSPYLNATGRIAGNVRTIRAPKRIGSSARSISGPNLALPAGRFWNFMRATTIPAATTVGSMQRTNSRCLCCRRV